MIVAVNDLISVEVFQAFSLELRVASSDYDDDVVEKHPAFLQ